MSDGYFSEQLRARINETNKRFPRRFDFISWAFDWLGTFETAAGNVRTNHTP